MLSPLWIPLEAASVARTLLRYSVFLVQLHNRITFDQNEAITRMFPHPNSPSPLNTSLRVTLSYWMEKRL